MVDASAPGLAVVVLGTVVVVANTERSALGVAAAGWVRHRRERS
ncbi:MAG: hypothetical protein WBG36_12910 [Ornithinimicrobium sp.]